MKLSVFTTILFLAGTQIAVAETCLEKFISLLTDRTAKEPTKILVTQKIKGLAKTVNWNYQDGKGETWTKVRDMEDQSEAHQKSLDECAKTVENAACGTEDVDGVLYETVEADYKMFGSFEADIHDKFWINSPTRYVARLETTMKNSAFESFTTRQLEPAPDLVFPVPE